MNASTSTECGHIGCTTFFGDVLATVPNAITGVRVVGVLVLAALAVQADDPSVLLAIALAVYWVGDMADGAVARWLHRESRTGAMLDILGDRLSVIAILGIYVSDHPNAALPAAIFLLQFGFVDAYLGTAFLRWSLLSANYFGLVDRRLYLANWSPVAKGLNTSAVVLLWLATEDVVVVSLVASLYLLLKLASLVRMSHISVPRALTGCAVVDSHPAALRSVAA
nr:CDP-alcohol phosphatidyltransferase family protein [Rhodococcus sp. (in: high G+C Gram-positive bacteria)]